LTAGSYFCFPLTRRGKARGAARRLPLFSLRPAPLGRTSSPAPRRRVRGSWTERGSPAGDRAPPRGVDVKPPRGRSFGTSKKGFLGSRTRFPPQNWIPGGSSLPSKSRKGRKCGYLPVFGCFWPFLAKFGVSGPPAGVAFTSTPRGGALYPLFGAFSRGSPGGAILGVFPPGRDLDLPGHPPGSRTRDRAPARGVDVKPPSRGWSARTPRPGRPENLSRGPREVPEGSPTTRGGPPQGDPCSRVPGLVQIPGFGIRGPRSVGVLHQPLAAGPCPRPAGPLRPGGSWNLTPRVSSRPPRPRACRVWSSN